MKSEKHEQINAKQARKHLFDKVEGRKNVSAVFGSVGRENAAPKRRFRVSDFGSELWK